MSKRINSRAKGARRERQWRDKCREAGFDAFRGSQFSGKNPTTGEAAPDVVTPGLRVHWEVKGVEKLNIYGAMEQCQRDRNDDEVGAVAHTKNGMPWLVTFLAEDAFDLLRESELVRKNKNQNQHKQDATYEHSAEGDGPSVETV